MSKLKYLYGALALCWLATSCTDEAATEVPATDMPSQPSETADAPMPPEQPPARLSTWDRSLASATESPLCFLDAINGMPATNSTFRTNVNEAVVLEGWLSTLDLQAPPELSIILDGSRDYLISGVTGIAREDVAQAYDAPPLARSGFKSELSELAIEPGTYSLLLSHEHEGTLVVCTPGLTLQVE